MPGAVPIVATGPLASSSPAKVLSPSKVCAPERPASSVETSGSAKLRDRARGDRRQVEHRPPGRVGVVGELEHRVGEEGRQPGGDPGAAVPGEEARLVDDPGLPARPRHQPHPGAVDPVGDVEVPAGPGAGGAGGDDVAGAVGRARRRRGQVPVEHGELHEAVEQPQRLVDGDVLLRLRREQIRQQEMGAGVGHGTSRLEGIGRAPEQTGASGARAALFRAAWRTCGAERPRLMLRATPAASIWARSTSGAYDR